MRGGDHYRHAGFAHQQTAQAVHHGDAADLARGGDFAPNPRHGPERHGFVALVFQEARAAALGVVADGAFKRYDRALRAGDQARGKGAGVDRATGQREVVAPFANLERGGVGSAAHRGQKGQFVAIPHLRREVLKLLVASGCDAAGHLPQARKPPGVVFEHGPQGGPGGQFGLFRGPSHQLLQDAEKQHSCTHAGL